MIRTIFLPVGTLLAVGFSYTLLFTGGQSRGGLFHAGSIQVEYEINAPGAVRPERLEYLVLSADEPVEASISYSDGRPTFTRSYHDEAGTNTVSFSIKPGQTVWIGKDRKVRIASTSLLMSDVKLLEKHGGSRAIYLSSFVARGVAGGSREVEGRTKRFTGCGSAASLS